MPLPSRDKIAGFDFEKNVVLVKTDLVFNGVSVREVLPLAADDKEVICDAWLDWRERQG